MECFFTGDKELGILDICSRVQLGKGTVHRLLKTLELAGFIYQNKENKKYRLGKKLLLLGIKTIDDFELKSISQPYMEELAQISGETVNLAILDNGKVVYISKIDSPKAVRIHTQLGKGNPAHSSAVGKILLSELSEDEVKEIANKYGLQPKTSNTITDLNELLYELKQVKRQQYALDLEEDEEGLMCVASGIRDRDGKIIAAISVSGPTIRFIKQKGMLTEAVKKVSRQISEELGFMLKNNGT